MDGNTVFVRTAKGRNAAVGILRTQLTPQLRILLALIDGKSDLDELQRKVTENISVHRLRAAIDVLLTHEYIEIVRSTAREDNNLDFSHLSATEPGPRSSR